MSSTRKDTAEAACHAQVADPLPEETRLAIAETLDPEYVGFVAWSGSPEPGRREAFYLDRRPEAWTLWRRMQDPEVCGGRWAWNLLAWTDPDEADPTGAAVRLVVTHFGVEAALGQGSFHVVGRPGWVPVEAWLEISRTVWPLELKEGRDGGPLDPYVLTEKRTLFGEPVGWRCSMKWVGSHVLCLACGYESRHRDCEFSYSRPITIDEIRPHPQTCFRCKKVMVEGILPGAPERFRGGRWKKE